MINLITSWLSQVVALVLFTVSSAAAISNDDTPKPVKCEVTDITGPTTICVGQTVEYTAVKVRDPVDPGLDVGDEPVFWSGDEVPDDAAQENTISLTFSNLGSHQISASCGEFGGSHTIQVTVESILLCPNNITVDNDPDKCEKGELDIGSPEINPNCPDIDVESAIIEGKRSDNKGLDEPYPVGETTINWTVTAGDLTDSCTQTVTVKDVEAPEILSPLSDVTVGNDPGECDAKVSYFHSIVDFKDNCDVTWSFDPPTDTLFPVGTNPVTVTVKDPSDNTASYTFNVTVEDREPPKITCPFAIPSVTAAPGESSAVVFFDDATATDNCDGEVEVHYTDQSGRTVHSGSRFPIGLTRVTCSATDAAGNSAVPCSFIVTVVQPTVILPFIGISDVEDFEGNSESKEFFFAVIMSPASRKVVRVAAFTSDGPSDPPDIGATVADRDYIPKAELLVFQPGQTAKFFRVRIRGDRKVERDEIFFVHLLANPIDVAILDGEGKGTIKNDD